MKIFEEARGYIHDKRYKIISDKMVDVGNYNVFLQKKNGRNILLCNCQNDTKFCIESPLCSHKIVFTIVNFNEKLYKEIDDAITQVKIWKELKFDLEPQLILDILEKIKNAK